MIFQIHALKETLAYSFMSHDLAAVDLCRVCVKVLRVNYA